MKHLITVTLASLLSAVTAHAATTAVFPVDATNLNVEEADAVGVMLAMAYADVSGELVLMPKRAANAILDCRFILIGPLRPIDARPRCSASITTKC